MDNRNAENAEDQPLPSPLISAPDLVDLVGDEGVVIVDCRFSLEDPSAGHRRWLESRIPGAFYAHLDHDLSLPVGDGTQGRHPLPGPALIRALLDRWGVGDDTLLVAYDDAGGAFASRLWWMARWIGHDAVCVLDGGWPAWARARGPMETAPSMDRVPLEPVEPGSVQVAAREGWLAKAEELLSGQPVLVDARAAIRYRGDEEPIDRVAGHIPGARNLPWMENLAPDGHFLPSTDLARRWQSVGGTDSAVVYCGSGVTACHNVLAAAAAGLPLPRLYAPSWSGWISNPDRPVETGEPR